VSVVRSVPLLEEDVRVLEELGIDLLRRCDTRASRVLAIVLYWRSIDPLAEGAEVIPIDRWSRRAP
jgi:hypothetical protein